jgi:hypothetical protein
MLLSLQARVDAAPKPPWIDELIRTSTDAGTSDWVLEAMTNLGWRIDASEAWSSAQWLAQHAEGAGAAYANMLAGLAGGFAWDGQKRPVLVDRLLHAATAIQDAAARKALIAALHSFEDRIEFADADPLVKQVFADVQPDQPDAALLRGIVRHLRGKALDSAIDLVIDRVEHGDRARATRPDRNLDRLARGLDALGEVRLSRDVNRAGAAFAEDKSRIDLAAALVDVRLSADRLDRLAHAIRRRIAGHPPYEINLLIATDGVKNLPCERSAESTDVRWLCQLEGKSVEPPPAPAGPAPSFDIESVLDDLEASLNADRAATQAPGATTAASHQVDGFREILLIDAATGRATIARAMQAIHATADAIADDLVRYDTGAGGSSYFQSEGWQPGDEPVGPVHRLQDVFAVSVRAGSLVREIAERSQLSNLDPAAGTLVEVAAMRHGPSLQRVAEELLALNRPRAVTTAAVGRHLQAMVQRVSGGPADELYENAIALRALASLATPDYRPFAPAALLDAAQRTTDPARFGILVAALADLGFHGDWPTITNLLAWPTCVGDCRQALLGMLDAPEGQQEFETFDDFLRLAQGKPGVTLDRYPQKLAVLSRAVPDAGAPEGGQEASTQEAGATIVGTRH